MPSAPRLPRPPRASRGARAPGAAPARRRVPNLPVVINGGGPVALTAALDCAARSIPCILLAGDAAVDGQARAACHAQRTLQIWGRVGVAAPLLERGVSWQLGRVFHDSDIVAGFDLQGEAPQHMPPMLNLPPALLDEVLRQACQDHPGIDLRRGQRALGVQPAADHAVVEVRTPQGVQHLRAPWVVDCDGSLAASVGAGFALESFDDRFLVADVVMEADFPAERWFWFDPPFHRGQAVLLHRLGARLWRIVWQLGAQADPDVEQQPARVAARLHEMLGPEQTFEIASHAVRQVAGRLIDTMRHGRVLFAGDAAHETPPFGARGSNAGVQDVDNLVWKLGLVIDGLASEALIDTYHVERAGAAALDLGAATRSADFISPRSHAARGLRQAVLELAQTSPLARPWVDSGRMSTPASYPDSPLNTPDEDDFAGPMAPGTPCVDVPVGLKRGPGWLLPQLGAGFVLLSFGAAAAPAVSVGGVQARVLTVGRELRDTDGGLARRYDARPGTVILMRPDQHVAARWRHWDAGLIEAALRRCLCL